MRALLLLVLFAILKAVSVNGDQSSLTISSPCDGKITFKLPLNHLFSRSDIIVSGRCDNGVIFTAMSLGTGIIKGSVVPNTDGVLSITEGNPIYTVGTGSHFEFLYRMIDARVTGAPYKISVMKYIYSSSSSDKLRTVMLRDHTSEDCKFPQIDINDNNLCVLHLLLKKYSQNTNDSPNSKVDAIHLAELQSSGSCLNGHVTCTSELHANRETPEEELIDNFSCLFNESTKCSPVETGTQTETVPKVDVGIQTDPVIVTQTSTTVTLSKKELKKLEKERLRREKKFLKEQDKQRKKLQKQKEKEEKEALKNEKRKKEKAALEQKRRDADLLKQEKQRQKQLEKEKKMLLKQKKEQRRNMSKEEKERQKLLKKKEKERAKLLKKQQQEELRNQKLKEKEKKKLDKQKKKAEEDSSSSCSSGSSSSSSKKSKTKATQTNTSTNSVSVSTQTSDNSLVIPLKHDLEDVSDIETVEPEDPLIINEDISFENEDPRDESPIKAIDEESNRDVEIISLSPSVTPVESSTSTSTTTTTTAPRAPKQSRYPKKFDDVRYTIGPFASDVVVPARQKPQKPSPQAKLDSKDDKHGGFVVESRDLAHTGNVGASSSLEEILEDYSKSNLITVVRDD